MKTSFYAILLLIITPACTKLEPGADYFFIRNENATLPVQVSGNISSSTFIIYLANYEIPSLEDHQNVVFKNVKNHIFESLKDDYAIVFFEYNRCESLGRDYCYKVNYNFNDIHNDFDLLIRVLEERYGPETSFFIFGRGFGASIALQYVDVGMQKDNINGIIANLPLLSLENAAEASKNQLIQTIHQKVGLESAVLDTLKNMTTNNFFDPYNYYNFFIKNYFHDKFEEFHEYDLFPGCVNSLNERTIGVNKNNFYHRYIFRDLETYRFNSPEFDITNNLHKINTPISLVWQKDALIVPLFIGEEIFNLLETTDKELHIFDDPCIPYFDESGEYIQNVIDFVEKHK